jgi:hypothetical protein
VYLAWAGIEVIRIVMRGRRPLAFRLFAEVWRTRVFRR